jgi:hypothetical protein
MVEEIGTEKYKKTKTVSILDLWALCSVVHAQPSLNLKPFKNPI